MTDPSPSSDLGPVIETGKRCACAPTCSVFAPLDFPDGWVSDHCRFRQTVIALLQEIEFGDGDKCGRTPDAKCPSCRRSRRDRHAPGCRLADVLDWAEHWA